MIEKATYVLTGMSIGVVLGITFAVTWPQDWREPPLIRVETHIRQANDVRLWQCTKDEFTEYKRACASRKRMELVKPKE